MQGLLKKRVSASSLGANEPIFHGPCLRQSRFYRLFYKLRKMLTVKRYSIVFLLCLMQFSCFDSNQQQDCLTSDTVAIIDSLSINEQEYFLVYRISGWHDKVESFEVYNTKPVFNACGERASSQYIESP